MTLKSNGELIAVYSYDALGRRIQKVVTNSGSLDGTTDYYLDGEQDIEEHNGSGILTQQYVYGSGINEVLALDRNLNGDSTATGPGDQRLFYYQNALGSVYALTDTTAKILEAYQYDAYGRQTVFDPGPSGVVVFGAGDVVTPGGVGLIGNPFLFTGMRLDPETGLYYDRARYLNSVQGRFIQRDTFGSATGSNLYIYADNAPTYFVDPTGSKVCAGGNWRPFTFGPSTPKNRKLQAGFGFVSTSLSIAPEFLVQVCSHCCEPGTPNAGKSVEDYRGTVGVQYNFSASLASWGGGVNMGPVTATVWLGIRGTLGVAGRVQFGLESDYCYNKPVQAIGCFSVSPYGELSIGGEASIRGGWLSVEVGLSGNARVRVTFEICVKCDLEGCNPTGFKYKGISLDIYYKACWPIYGCLRGGFSVGGSELGIE